MQTLTMLKSHKTEVFRDYLKYLSNQNELSIDFQRKFRERLCRLVHFPELFTVASHEHRNFSGGLGKMQQGSVHFLL